jgi:hypothetical protein
MYAQSRDKGEILVRILKVAVAALSVVLLTTGCVKLNVDLTVDSNDTVSGTMVFALAKGLAELGEETDPSATGPDTQGLLKESENVVVEKFDDGEYVGSTYKFENLPLEQFTPKIDDVNAFGLTRDGDNIVVSGILDTSSAGDDLENNPFGEAFLAGIIDSSDIRVSITLPGEIKETNGTVEGQTITWTGSFGKRLEIDAIAYAPKIDPLILIIGTSLAFGALVWLITLFILRIRRRTSKNFTTLEDPTTSIPSKRTVSSKVGLSDADIKVLESEYASNPERFAMDYLSQSEFKKWRSAGEPSLRPWIGMGMVNFKKWLDLHK